MPSPNAFNPRDSGTNVLSAPPVLCIVGTSAVKLFGLSGEQRLCRQFARAGVKTEIKPNDLARQTGTVILVRADASLDPPLIPALIAQPGLVLTSEHGTPLAGHVSANKGAELLTVLQNSEAKLSSQFNYRAPSQLDANFWKSLRKRETPYALLTTAQSVADDEWRMFMGTYKGATDLVTKHLWPRPAFVATRFLAPLGVTPNMVTTIAAIMTVLAFYLFWRGEFMTGLIAAWTMTFLDTVDGKLARTTLTSSKWGDVFDHGIDLVHPPFWYWAWGLGLGAWGISWSNELFWWVLVIILGGYVLQRVMEGISIKWLGLEIHIWRPIDTFFRQITARRNPNLILLTIATIIQKPDWGLISVAAWTAACLVLHGLQLLQAFAAKRAAPLQSWMSAK
jgi:phosphatidylglycerophosphate synthase